MPGRYITTASIIGLCNWYTYIFAVNEEKERIFIRVIKIIEFVQDCYKQEGLILRYAWLLFFRNNFF
jgi:hypothetical protein